MKTFNVISGLPRAGSTLLCNILNQNPDMYAGSTSPLPELIGNLIHTASRNPEMTAALAHDKEGTTNRLKEMVACIIESWYKHRKEDVVFDKSRGWSFNSLLLQQLFENIKIIICVRDLRAIFGSIEKQHRKNPMFDAAANPIEKTINARADTMFSPQGMVGLPIVGIEDLLARTPQNVFVMQYEAFTIDPATKIKELYQFLDLEYYDHDYDDVVNVSEDLDALYHNKFPHEGEGKIEPTNRNEWQEYIPAELAQKIGARYPFYNQRFGYS